MSWPEVIADTLQCFLLGYIAVMVTYIRKGQ